MVWTYEDKNLGLGGKDDLRAMIGDNVSTDPLLQDEELNFFIGQRSSLLGAAANACRSLSAKFARSVDQAAGTFKTSFSQMSKAYFAQAIQFEVLAAQGGTGLPYAGGISLTDKTNQENDDDRKSPEFVLGMDDSASPVPPIGPQTEIGLGAGFSQANEDDV